MKKCTTLKLETYGSFTNAVQWLKEAFISKGWMTESNMSIPVTFREMPKHLQQEEFEKWLGELEKAGVVTFFLENSEGEKAKFIIFNKNKKVPFITAKLETQDDRDDFYYGILCAENVLGKFVEAL